MRLDLFISKAQLQRLNLAGAGAEALRPPSSALPGASARTWIGSRTWDLDWLPHETLASKTAA